MAERHRKRQRKISVYLSDEECDILTVKSIDARMSKTSYIRNVILYGAARGSTNFSLEQGWEIMHELSIISSNINRIAYVVTIDRKNKRCEDCQTALSKFDELENEFHKYLAAFGRYARD